jgi:hypothetical protein
MQVVYPKAFLLLALPTLAQTVFKQSCRRSITLLRIHIVLIAYLSDWCGLVCFSQLYHKSYLKRFEMLPV